MPWTRKAEVDAIARSHLRRTAAGRARTPGGQAQRPAHTMPRCAALAAVEALASCTPGRQAEELVPTVASALDDGALPLPALLAEASTLASSDALRLVLLRTLTLLIRRRGATGGQDDSSAAAAALFEAYRDCVAWPVLHSSSGRGASHREACVCLHRVAEAAGRVPALQDECVTAIEGLVQRLSAGVGEGEAGELCALGACELAAELCQDGAWREGFGRRVLPALLQLLPLESAAAIGLVGLAETDEVDASEMGEPEHNAGLTVTDEVGDDEDEGSSVQSIARQSILRRISDCAPAAELPAVAALLWQNVRSLLPLERGEAVHQYNSGGNQALGLSLGCDFHEMLFASDARATADWVDARDDPAFWAMLRDCLLDPRMEVRTLALDLLRHAVADGSSEDTADAGEAGLTAAWEVFAMVYETLQQFAVHLLEGVWPGIRQMFDVPGGTIRGPKPSHPRLPVNEWAAVLFRRGMSSENHAVQRMVLFSTLDGKVYDREHSRISDEVVFDGILPTCRGMWLYKQVTQDDEDSEVAPLLREFLSRHLTSTAAAGGVPAATAFIMKIVEHLHNVPDTVTSRARMTLIGILEHLRVPETAAALIGDDGLRELRGIVVDQVPLEHSEASRDSILLAALSTVCRFGAPVAGQTDGHMSFSAVARLLLNFPVELLAGEPAASLLATLTVAMGASWLSEGLQATVAGHLAAVDGQRSSDAAKALPVMLALASRLGDEAEVLYEVALAPAVKAVSSALTHLYAPRGQAEAAIELLDAVLRQDRAALLDRCLARMIGDECESIAGYLGACIGSRLEALMHTGAQDPSVKGDQLSSATAVQYAEFLVRCRSLLLDVNEGGTLRSAADDGVRTIEGVMEAAVARAAEVLTSGKQYSALDGCDDRNRARIDALASLAIVSPAVRAGAAADVAGLLTALLAVELEVQPADDESYQMADSDVSNGEGYGQSRSDRRNIFGRWKWDCLCIIIRRIEPYGESGSEEGATQFPANDSAGLATALIAAVECSADALDILSPGQGAAAASNMLIPIFEMLRHALPWYVAQLDTDASWEAKHARLERVIEPAWTAFAEVDKKTLPLLLTAITLFLLAPLWGDVGWHSERSPFKRMYGRLAEMGGSNRSTRVMSTVSLYCCRLWTKHPRTAAMYLDEVPTICCYTNAHDEASKAHQHSAAVIRIPDEQSPACAVDFPTAFPARASEETARFASRVFFQYLCKCANDAGGDPEDVHYELAVSFMRKLLARNKSEKFSGHAYAPGSDMWKLKIVLWQAIGVLAECVRPGTEFALEVHSAFTEMMKRNDAPTVRQQADAAVVTLFLRCPELLNDPAWLPTTLADFKSPPQVAMSLMVITQAMLPRFDPQMRARIFPRLFTSLVTWANAGNRALRAMALVVVGRVMVLAEQGRNEAADGAEVDGNGWPDLQEDQYYRSLWKYLHGSPEGRAFTFKLGPYLDVFQPEELCSPLTVVRDVYKDHSAATTGDDPEDGRVAGFPMSVYELMKDSFKGMVSKTDEFCIKTRNFVFKMMNCADDDGI